MALAIKNLDAPFGAQVSGLTPRIPLAEEEKRALRAAFDDRSLLIFRDFPIDMAFQTYLSNMLVGMSDERAAQPETFVSNRVGDGGGAPFGGLLWHSDMMWSENAFRLLSLYGSNIEEPSVPTQFISTTHAWSTLPADLRARLEGRSASHGRTPINYEDRADVMVSQYAQDHIVALPVARTHPKNGRTMLYVCERNTYGLTDMPKDESDKLMKQLFEHLYKPENVVEHLWRTNDLVMWDNLALQHARPNVRLDGPERTLRKTYAPAIQFDMSQAPKSVMPAMA